MTMTEPTSLAEYRVKRRLKRAREWAEIVGSCMYCGDEFLWKDRHEHHCLHPSQGDTDRAVRTEP